MDLLHTTTDLTWAAPVNIVDLYSSLAAWHHTKKVVTTLRLCCRHGTGPKDCPKLPVATLPLEITEMIIQEIFDQDLIVQRDQWRMWQACAEHHCDHTPYWEEFVAPDPDLITEDILAGAVCHLHDVMEQDEETLEKMVNHEAASYHGLSQAEQLCNLRQWIWSQMLALASGFPVLNTILRTDFGLSILIVRQNGRGRTLQGSLTDLNETSRNFIPQAYIVHMKDMSGEVLTSDFHAKETIEDTIHSPEGVWAQSTITKFVDPSIFIPTPELVHRFREALRKLKLVPELNDAQIVYTEPSLLPEWDLADETMIRMRLEDELNGQWPKLLNLVQATVSLKR